ncbi:MAG: DNA repair and recombination protein RadB [Candidatus Syntropharchaeia archaeon]
MKQKKYSSGCKAIDDLLGGGFEAGTVTQVYGEAGSGKTNICIQLAVECAKNGERVVYIDSEGLSPERFAQIAGEDSKKIAERIIIYEPLNFEQQSSAIREIDKFINENVGMIILDSATIFYRIELDEEKAPHLKKELANQIVHLLELARKFDVAVIVTNQVYMDIYENKLRPVGGYLLEHLSKIIIQLEKLENGRRRAIIRKHRSQPEGLSCEFVITEKGVRDFFPVVP